MMISRRGMVVGACLALLGGGVLRAGGQEPAAVKPLPRADRNDVIAATMTFLAAKHTVKADKGKVPWLYAVAPELGGVDAKTDKELSKKMQGMGFSLKSWSWWNSTGSRSARPQRFVYLQCEKIEPVSATRVMVRTHLGMGTGRPPMVGTGMTSVTECYGMLYLDRGSNGWVVDTKESGEPCAG